MVDDGGKFRESIWSIHPKWRGWFYGVLSVCGVAVSVFTIWTLCRRDPSESWIDIFDAVWNGIVGSVIVVWFVFQVTESVMGAYQYFQDLKEQKLQKIRKEAGDQARKEEEKARKEAEEKARKEAEEQARQEEQERREQFAKEVVKLLEKNHAPQEDIQQVQYISDSLKPPNYP